MAGESGVSDCVASTLFFLYVKRCLHSRHLFIRRWSPAQEHTRTQASSTVPALADVAVPGGVMSQVHSTQGGTAWQISLLPSLHFLPPRGCGGGTAQHCPRLSIRTVNYKSDALSIGVGGWWQEVKQQGQRQRGRETKEGRREQCGVGRQWECSARRDRGSYIFFCPLPPLACLLHSHYSKTPSHPFCLR